ncbi:MAG: hypothetical protein IPH58_14820 [Sphingobacteriales bacterium]|jgi:hypothetical protein|nr:hypothetical protein [Sphingobacteriales bacterium]
MTNTNYPSSTQPENNYSKNSNGGRNLIIGLLVAALLGTWGYMLWDKNASTGSIAEKNAEIANTMSESDSLRQLFNLAEMRLDSITGANNSLQGERTSLQREIETKKIEINKILTDKNATNTDLKRARHLIGELNGQIGRLEVQVTKLKGENQQLTAQNTVLNEEKTVLNQNLQTKAAENEELANTVDVGSTLSASGMIITPLKIKKGGKEKETAIAKRVDKLQISFNVENRITTSGPADLYVIVSDPNGKIVQNASLGSGAITTRQDGDRNFTAKLPIEYERGTKKGISFSIQNNDGFKKGDYRIEVYHNGFKIGEGIRSLKKGLFG